MKILLIEDNESIIKSLEYSLTENGFEIISKTTAQEGKKEIDKKIYDLVLLDISLPDGNGFSICEYIKRNKDIPVIFLTARDEESNVVLGLDLGADDYITKPFRTRELISRINTVMRRYSKEEGNLIKIKNITIDNNTKKVLKNGKELIFTALEYKILFMLCNNINNVITREQILEKIWDIVGNFVNDNTLTVYIKRIREKIEDDPQNPEIIKTVRGIGYKVEK